MELKKGMEIEAINPCIMCNESRALTVGKKYEILEIRDKLEIRILDDQNDIHLFSINRIWEFFKMPI